MNATRSPIIFSDAFRAEAGLDSPFLLEKQEVQKRNEATKVAALHVLIARLFRLFAPPSPAQAAIEADADQLAAEYSTWWGQCIASDCSRQTDDEAGRSPETWRRIAWELSWRMGCEPRRVPRVEDLRPRRINLRLAPGHAKGNFQWRSRRP